MGRNKKSGFFLQGVKRAIAGEYGNAQWEFIKDGKERWWQGPHGWSVWKRYGKYYIMNPGNEVFSGDSWLEVARKAKII